MLQKTFKLVYIANVETPIGFVLIKSNPILIFGFDFGDHPVMVISRCLNAYQYTSTIIGCIEQFMGEKYGIINEGLKREWVTWG
jgi:hypothetical protein